MTIPAFASQGMELAAAIDAEIKALPVQNTPALRAVRRKYSRILQEDPAEFILQLARDLCKIEKAYRWIAYELIRGHLAAFERLGPTELEALGQGINSWWTVDAFARTLSGPAWLRRQVPDQLIIKWAGSNDRWWRRAALVSAVALNERSQGGQGMWCAHCASAAFSQVIRKIWSPRRYHGHCANWLCTMPERKSYSWRNRTRSWRHGSNAKSRTN